MKFEEDYVMRMIKDMVKALACVVFGKRFTEYEVEEEKADDTDFLYRDIIEMADQRGGKHTSHGYGPDGQKIHGNGHELLSSYQQIHR